MEDVKASLNSKELKKKISENWVENQSSAFVVKIRKRKEVKKKNRKSNCNYCRQLCIGNLIAQNSKKINKLEKSPLL